MITKSRIYILIILAFTGFGYAALAPSIYYIYFFLFLIFLYLTEIKKFKIKYNSSELNKFMLVVLPFAAILIYQYFNPASIPLSILIDQCGKLFLYFFISYMILKRIKQDFHIVFIDIMYFLTIVSLILYPTQFYIPLQEVIKETFGSIISPLGFSSGDVSDKYISKTLFFFTYHHNYGHPYTGIPRNCGAFWEPGVFGFFLVLALAFNTMISGKNILSTRNLVFIIAIFTTFSTTAVLATFLVFTYYFLINSKISLGKRITVVTLLILIFFNGVWQLDFISGKIFQKIEDADSDMGSRFGAVLYHLLLVKDNLFTGVGLKYVFEGKNELFDYKKSAPNGISFLLMYWGMLGLVFYLIVLYAGIRNWIANTYNSVGLHHNFIFFLLLFLSFSQSLTIKIFFVFLLSMFIVFDSKKPDNMEQVKTL